MQSGPWAGARQRSPLPADRGPDRAGRRGKPASAGRPPAAAARTGAASGHRPDHGHAGYNEAGLRGLLDPRRGRHLYFTPRRAGGAGAGPGHEPAAAAAGLRYAGAAAAGLARVMERQDVHVLMTYQLAGGSAAERAAGAQWLSEAAEPADAEHVLVTPERRRAGRRDPGLRPGRRRHRFRAAGLSGLLAAAEQLGRRVVVAETDDEGMTPTGLERACRESGSRLVYLNPTLQNPTTRTLTESRRCDLLRSRRLRRAGDRGRSLSPVPGRRAADHGQPGARLGLTSRRWPSA